MYDIIQKQLVHVNKMFNAFRIITRNLFNFQNDEEFSKPPSFEYWNIVVQYLQNLISLHLLPISLAGGLEKLQMHTLQAQQKGKLQINSKL